MMDEWRFWAKHGLWSYIDPIVILANGDLNEIEALQEVLSMVVPIMKDSLEGDGPLGRQRRANASDKESLLQCVDRGTYGNSMQEVAKMLAHVQWPNGETTPEELLGQEESKAGSRRLAQVRMLRFAANILDTLLTGEPEEPGVSWLGIAEALALRILEAEGINFGGLDTTFVTKVQTPETTQRSRSQASDIDGCWRQVPSVRDGITLFHVYENDTDWVGSRLWHAVGVLCNVSHARKALSLLPPESQNIEPWQPTEVVSHMFEQMERSYWIGAHCEALDVKWMERSAQERAKKTQSLRDHNQQRQQDSIRDNKDLIQFMKGEIAQGAKLSKAARDAFQAGIGASAGANRKKYERSKK